LFLTTSGREAVGTVRRQRTSWLTVRLTTLTAEDRTKIKASLAALDRVSMGDR
jgi:hypothetical protein